MGDPHEIPANWIAEAGLQDFKPARSAFRCNESHELIALADIEKPRRDSGYMLDQNGFGRQRMMEILHGIRNDDSMPAILVERGDSRPYRVRHGFHRFYASLAIGFLQLPVKVVDRYD